MGAAERAKRIAAKARALRHIAPLPTLGAWGLEGAHPNPLPGPAQPGGLTAEGVTLRGWQCWDGEMLLQNGLWPWPWLKADSAERCFSSLCHLQGHNLGGLCQTLWGASEPVQCSQIRCESPESPRGRVCV